MRKESIDNYKSIALIGNNIYDMLFMKYLFFSQNVHSDYCEKYKIVDEAKEKTLRNIAYYFGTIGPVLIDNQGLRKIFNDSGIPKTSVLPNLSSEDIMNQIKLCLKSDAVYVCNSNGNLDKYTMFILGYIMAMEQEIFFWNELHESEWLMSCISRKNVNRYKEVVQFPLEIIRSFAFPYLFKKHKLKMSPGNYRKIIVDDEGNIGVDRNTEFNLRVRNLKSKENTISLLGSLRKQLGTIKEKKLQLEKNGLKVLAPKLSNIRKEENGFILFEDDVHDNPIEIESDFLENCLKSESILICDKDGYIGNTVMFEIGYLLAKKKKIEFIEEPMEKRLINVVNYFSGLDNINILTKRRD